MRTGWHQAILYAYTPFGYCELHEADYRRKVDGQQVVRLDQACGASAGMGPAFGLKFAQHVGGVEHAITSLR